MIIGIVLIFRKNAYSSTVIGTVNSSTCTPSTVNGVVSNICQVTISYTVNNIVYTNIISSSTNYTTNQTVSLSYDPTNPINSVIGPPTTTTTLGIGLVIGAIIVVSFAWLWVYLTKKYKFLAAATGTEDVLNIFKRK